MGYARLFPWGADPLNTQSPNFGLIGLGVMGRNLALNLVDHDIPILVHSYAAAELDAFDVAAAGRAPRRSESLATFIEGLTRPRAVMIMVTAGDAVDSVIGDLLPLLDEGDAIIDGGNSHYLDTQKREVMLRENGLRYLGVGISGGEEGARHGASIMVGGDEESWRRNQDVLVSLGAEANGRSCVTRVGPDGAGHFVKMVHNGIEYALMQLLAEIWQFAEQGLGWSREQQREVFRGWCEGPASSFLLEITADILNVQDELTDGYLLDRISDRAGQKGTGRWTSEAALMLGVPVPSINSALTERLVSGYSRPAVSPKEKADSSVLKDEGQWPHLLEQALVAGMTIAFAQGFALMQAASKRYDWSLPMSEVARTWQGGCIVRARLLVDLAASLDAASDPHQFLNSICFDVDNAWQSSPVSALRQLVMSTASCGLSSPVSFASLAYVDALAADRLPTSLIQAQRDRFGAHRYERDDRDGSFHTEWPES